MRSRPAAVLLIAAFAALAGCGGGSSGAPAVPVQGINVGQGISLADCRDWEQANTQQRLGTIRELRNFAGGPVVGSNAEQPHGSGSVLDDSKAYDLLDNYCKNSFARGFKLYKLYERAAAFTGAPEG
jgi:hypothetical protein